ncbi:unnamed protein product, partial [Closterium sp. NIES-54]
CLEEAHRPVDCETVGKWILKNSAESENMNWILANSKSCPKCKRPIEKNQGCMHMTCTPPCKYEFCWLCLGAWSEHGEKTGGFYACNRYESAKHDGVYDETERRREMAKNSLEKYTHYYERWAANEQVGCEGEGMGNAQVGGNPFRGRSGGVGGRWQRTHWRSTPTTTSAGLLTSRWGGGGAMGGKAVRRSNTLLSVANGPQVSRCRWDIWPPSQQA